jgi:hypothetical protein
MEHALERGWADLISRLDGPMHFRFIVQPAVAMLLALRAGVRDAIRGEPPFLAAVLRNPKHRSERLRQALGELGTVLLAAVVLDAIYQTWIHEGIFLFELLVTAALLVLVPYALVRGPARRVAGAWLARRGRAPGPHGTTRRDPGP